MQTLNFNCPHCGNLMAVSTNLLGRNVRCPHCKQVVQAPAGTRPPATPPVVPAPPSPPAPQLPKFNLPPKDPEHHESIFSERHDEDLFGSEPPKPQLPQVSNVQRPAQRTMEIMTTPVETPSVLHISPPLTSVEHPVLKPSDFRPDPAHVDSPPSEPPIGGDLFAASMEPPTQIRSRTKTESTAASRPESTSASNAFAWLLLTYAGLMTIAAGYFGYSYFTRTDTKDSPFKAIPDVYGEYEKANRKQTSLNWLPDPRQALPADLRVALGGELQVGDLLVKPISVEKKLLRCVTQYDFSNEKNRDVPPKTLVLTMKVKNLSEDTIFHPNDPAFNRAYDKHSTPQTFGQEKAPYTGLQIRNEFFHGIFPWPNGSGVAKQYVVGHESDEKPLLPGEERDTWVMVAPAVDVLKTMPRVDPQEPLLWRVQLRRGLVPYTDSDGSRKEISATSVIGVEFTMNDVK